MRVCVNKINRPLLIMDPNPVHVASVEDLKESLNFLEICEENVYELIVEGISPYIRKDDTGKENPITPDQQLSIVLRLFLHGQDLTALETITKISQPVLQTIIQDVSASILLAFADDYMLVSSDSTGCDNGNDNAVLIQGNHFRIQPNGQIQIGRRSRWALRKKPVSRTV